MSKMPTSQQLKSLLLPLRKAMADFSEAPVRSALSELCTADVKIRMCHPFGDLYGTDAFYRTAYAPLLQAMPDLERRELIVVAGKTAQGEDWLGAMGNYICLLYTSPSPRDRTRSRMPSSA